MKRSITLLVGVMCLFACGFTASAGILSAQKLLRLYPVPDAPLAMDPAADPLLRLVNKTNPLPSSYKPPLVTPRVKSKAYARTDLRPQRRKEQPEPGLLKDEGGQVGEGALRAIWFYHPLSAKVVRHNLLSGGAMAHPLHRPGTRSVHH